MVGNRTHVATHFDEASNVAVVVAGRRRFTLFSPKQVGNLYVGPFHFTIAGPPFSMVDLEDRDLERYPKFADALGHGLVADLDPGDALFIPPIWWHSVKAIAAFNVMVNYWWAEAHALSPMSALSHAVLAIRGLAPAQLGMASLVRALCIRRQGAERRRSPASACPGRARAAVRTTKCPVYGTDRRRPKSAANACGAQTRLKRIVSEGAVRMTQPASSALLQISR